MKKTLCFLTALFISTLATAATRPFNLSLTPRVAVYDRDDSINGLTLSVWGENKQESLALGLINGTAGDSLGASLGIINYAADYRGLQWGIVNHALSDMSGWQGGFFFGLVGSIFNYTGGDMTGFQTGAVNYAGNLLGFQLGVVNYARDTHSAGLQIGLVNVIKANTAWFSRLPDELAPAMVFVNWRF